jgi:pyruvate,water dikinase
MYEGFARSEAVSGDGFTQVIRRINTYFYFALKRTTRREVALPGDLPTPADNFATWEQRWLPEIRRSLDTLAAVDLAGATDEGVARQIDDTIERVARMWMIHGFIRIGQGEFSDLCVELLDLDEVTTLRMLQGFSNKSLEADDGIRALARLAGQQPELAATVRMSAPDRLLDAVAGVAGGSQFLAAVAAYLHEFGRRSDNFAEFSLPSWREQPAPLLALVRAYLDVPDDIAERRARLVAQREATIAEVRSRISREPAELRERFESGLATAQRTTVLNEDHNYWIDQQGLHWVRQVLVEAGRRLAARGAIEAADDVFYLRIDELRQALRASGVVDLRPLVGQRRAEMEHFSAVQPPYEVGRHFPLPDGLERVFGFGTERDADAVQQPLEVTGQAASAGVLRARARLIESIGDAGRLGSGEVLVTATTSPPWTPLFGVAGAVVTDAGGSLSHVAIVAREYAIPAVVGCGDATTVIPDGALVEVNGDTGTVTILERP